MLEMSAVTKRFGSQLALDDCTFTVAPERVTGFLGPNGAGKTTAMRAVFGLVQPDGGSVVWMGRPVASVDRRRFGYMPEERGVYPKMRLRDQVVFFARLSGMTGRAAGVAADRWLERLGLSDRASARVEELSHGNQQRVQLVLALVHDPELLVLDEPFSGLDPIAVDGMVDLLRERARAGAAVLFSSHQLELVEDLCEDVVIIDRGRVVLAGAVDGLRQAAPWRTVELTVTTTDPRWVAGLEGVRVDAQDDGHVRLLLERTHDPRAVLNAAAEVGEVTRVAYGPPSLADLFRQAVRP
jgi:ABC-2 type transport system ATP-binding protein